jgi:large subunit ribosomal protein L21
MYAVIRQGGKQYKVSKGEMLVLDRIDAEVGSSLKLGEVLAVRDAAFVTGSDAAKASVTAIVVDHFKGDKVLVFKYKAKKNYHRTFGHRQPLTKVKIEEISMGKPAVKKAAPKAAAKAAPVVEAPVEESKAGSEQAE